MTVNGRPVSAAVEPRTHLADFVRGHVMLTGTHLGCEHGVCGACTMLVDGQPVRSCLTYAVACESAEVRTIEGFDDDPVMTQLRAAFSTEHALQCGYCTPGMLVTARDIVLRLPNADNARVRQELAGNLCRCTGYVGIVNAIRRVLDARLNQAATTSPPRPAPTQQRAPAPPISQAAVTMPTVPAAGAFGNRIEKSFTVHHARQAVWEFFADVAAVAPCMPGASLTGPTDGRHVEGQVTVRMGPIAAAFRGMAEITRDEANYSGIIRGSGADERSGSQTRGEVAYKLAEAEDGKATRVDLAISFTLTGALAQFSRGGLVNEIAGRLTATFAQNLERQLDARARGETAAPAQTSELRAASLMWSVVWDRLKSAVAKIFGRE